MRTTKGLVAAMEDEGETQSSQLAESTSSQSSQQPQESSAPESSSSEPTQSDPASSQSVATEELDLNEDLNEVNEASDDINQANNDSDELVKHVSNLENTLPNDGASQQTIKVVNIAAEAIYKRLGINAKLPALENFATRTSRKYYTPIAIEGFSDVLNNIGNAVSSALRKAWQMFLEFLKRAKDYLVGLYERIYQKFSKTKIEIKGLKQPTNNSSQTLAVQAPAPAVFEIEGLGISDILGVDKFAGLQLNFNNIENSSKLITKILEVDVLSNADIFLKMKMTPEELPTGIKKFKWFDSSGMSKASDQQNEPGFGLYELFTLNYNRYYIKAPTELKEGLEGIKAARQTTIVEMKSDKTVTEVTSLNETEKQTAIELMNKITNVCIEFQRNTARSDGAFKGILNALVIAEGTLKRNKQHYGNKHSATIMSIYQCYKHLFNNIGIKTSSLFVKELLDTSGSLSKWISRSSI